eukprot:CAMPEP_0206166062 /NCGR_PEP_ID=MMETSP1474-20131121/22677_1 /ASSEMBLY_ACC=CAM_ASM_001110 /TAXON_ID=97495 /ORGANISM="Imantonia sp., Strain RCC918" /LENGTH=201 /DNA_ID=CAMNT_0053569829 /DNA_START=1 /DNA_END=606 /DNA_ORIENTATION=-
MRLLVLTACLLLLTDARTAAEKETMQKAIRMKTSRQLKEIFDELGIDHKGLDKDALRKKAYKEDAVGRWEELHPDKKPKPRSAPGGGGGGGGGGMPDFGGKAPEGYDQAAWEKLMAQMRGDFGHEKDPEKRRILEKLKAKGMSFGGQSDMDIEQLRNMEKMMDGLGSGGFGAGTGAGPGASDERDAPSVDEDIGDEDKMEL